MNYATYVRTTICNVLVVRRQKINDALTEPKRGCYPKTCTQRRDRKTASQRLRSRVYNEILEIMYGKILATLSKNLGQLKKS